MRLARIGAPGAESPVAVLPGGSAVDISSVCSPISTDIDGAFLRAGGLDRVKDAIEGGGLPTVDTDGVRFGPPVARPGKIVCIGLNYRDHAAETGAELPTEPVLFLKAPYTVVGPDDDVLIPRGSIKTDYEVELAVVIGHDAAYLPDEQSARDVIAGYTISHDVSEREFQLERGGTWDKGKSCDTFNPMGPWLVTADEIAEPQDLGLRLSVNGEKRQDGRTSDMVFGVPELVRYVSQFMRLEAGDVINTGTPAGVALGMQQPAYLCDGDIVEIEIDQLGRQRQRLVQA